MSGQSAAGGGAPPEVVYIIRHGEKPAEPPGGHGNHQPDPGPPHGIDFHGRKDEHSLLPRGWQRSGALAALFSPASSARAGLRTPGTLLAPSYGDVSRTSGHRTWQTIQGLADLLGLAISTPYEVGHEPRLADSVLNACSGVVLICWEHHHIPALAAAFPAAPGTDIPGKWPGHRFDVIWALTLQPGSAQPRYAFSQAPQQLLPGDTDAIIAAE
jgi:hypothetical protein